jgi:hypothetical protein
VVDTGEHVEQRAIVGGGKPDAIGGDHRHAECLRQPGERHEIGFFVAQQVTLKLDADVGAAEEADKPIEQPCDTVVLRIEHWTAGERHKTAGASLELLERERALPLRCSHLHARDQAAEVAIAVGRSDEYR